MFMENIRAKMNIFHDNFAVVMKNVYRCSCVCTAMISIFCLSKVDLLNPPPPNYLQYFSMKCCLNMSTNVVLFVFASLFQSYGLIHPLCHIF